MDASRSGPTGPRRSGESPKRAERSRRRSAAEWSEQERPTGPRRSHPSEQNGAADEAAAEWREQERPTGPRRSHPSEQNGAADEAAAEWSEQERPTGPRRSHPSEQNGAADEAAAEWSEQERPTGPRRSEDWRRRPDLNRGWRFCRPLNRGWRFCRPLPYHLATAPVGTELDRGIPAASGAATTAFDQASNEHRQHAPVRLKPDTTNNGRLPPSPPSGFGEAGQAGRTTARPVTLARGAESASKRRRSEARRSGPQGRDVLKIGAGNGIRTRDFDLGKVALYH